jgi:hypothetical protein
MTRADNTRFLTRAAASRHQATLKKATDAIEHLDSTGQPVNFSAVAAAAGVSRDSLYRNPGIRDLITRMRSAPPRSAATRTAERATADSLRVLLSTARAEITRLRAENTMLRDQAARHLGEQRAATRPRPQPEPAPTPAAPRTPRQRHAHDAKTPHHKDITQTDLR